MVKYVQPVVNQGESVHYQAHGYVLILLQRSQGQMLPSPKPEARVDSKRGRSAQETGEGAGRSMYDSELG